MDLSRGQKLLVVTGLVALLAGIVVLSLGRMASNESTVTYVAPQQDTTATPGYLAVDVIGAVLRPGVYRLPPGSRTEAAIAAAGGLLPEADRSSVNLAAPLEDGQQVKVMSQLPPPAPIPAATVPPATSAAPPTTAPPALASPTPAPPVKVPQGVAVAFPLSLNQATKEQLEALPGLGPELAERIVYYRYEHGAFRSVEDLARVPGIGEHRMGTLRPYLRP